MPRTHITDYLAANAAEFPKKSALICADRQFTWKELWDEVESVANFFSSELGNEQQKIVSILIPNTWQFVVTYLAVLEAGHIATPVDVIYKPLEINAILLQSSASMLIVDRANAPRVEAGTDFVLFDDIPQHKPNQPRLRLPADEQIASLVFTSGTTGKPKMATYSHSNHLWNIKACSEVWDWSPQDTMLLSLRLSHWYGICLGLSGSIYHSNTLYLEENFNAQQTLTKLASGKISFFTHTPLAFAKMMETEGEYDLSQVRVLISGSAALPPALWHSFEQRFGHKIIECYGSSETGRIAANSLDDRVPGSPGRILREVDAKLSKNGELLVKSPGLFPGYFKNEEATKQHLSEDGYWHTGDIAEINDGRLTLKGRKQETIRKQGYSVSPRDIEWALLQNKSIRECSVVGAGDGSSDDQIVYFISGEVSEAELRAYTKSSLPSIWRPDKIIFIDALPRTRNGKVSLPQLRAMIN